MIGAPVRLIKRIPLGVWLVLLLSAYIWRMALFGDRTLVHGDSLLLGLPSFDLRHRAVFGHASALWQDTIFGGHPLFAESQGAFASLVPMALAALATPFIGPFYTANFFHVVCMTLTGAGMIGLTRNLGASPAASTFAALAVIFAPMWLNLSGNMVLEGTFMWVPWTLWAFEIWLKRPTVGAAVMIALAGSNLIVAGYPQAPHGTAYYMLFSLLPSLCRADFRHAWIASWRARLASGAVAMFLALGLSAVQLLPLAELIGESHRSDGTALSFNMPSEFFLRGLIYSVGSVMPDVKSLTIPSIGSLLVCVLASAAIVFNRSSSRVVGHLFASLILIQMGFGLSWPPFKVVYDLHLIFGLHYLRDVFLYITIGIVGFGVLSAFAIDGIARYFGAPPNGADWHAPGSRRAVWGTLALTAGWLAVLAGLPSTITPQIEFVVVLASIAGIALLGWMGRASLIPPLFVVLLIVECTALRFHPFHLASIDVARKPDSVVAIQTLPDWREYKVIDGSTAAAFAFLKPDNPDVIPGVRRMLGSLSGSTTMRWGLHGMDGSLALPLARRTKLTPILEDEISGRSASAPGLRFIDILGIRFIATDGIVPSPAFRTFWQDADGVTIMENTAALPRFQVYGSHVTVGSLDDAIDAIKNGNARKLVIENPSGSSHQPEMPDSVGSGDESAPPLTFHVQRAESTAYTVDVTAEKAAWLFLADANYPGWTATLDGKDVPLFSAQVLGKAVGIPAGHHTLSIRFHSASFTWGLWISIISAALAVFAMLYDRRRTAAGFRNVRTVA